MSLTEKSPLKNFGFTYEHEGTSFVFHIVAESADEALSRQASMAGAIYEGVMELASDEGRAKDPIGESVLQGVKGTYAAVQRAS